jgi:mannose-6-phosphate isomerase
MQHAAHMQNAVQPYAWGSTTSFSELLGIPNPDRTPQAEIWMGAHPKAPSAVETDSGWQPLDRLIEQQPESILGSRTAGVFDRKLPFLFKVLAAGEPLSIQAHPDLAQAREGFARENRSGLSPAADERNYRDPNHKPECLCALTPFSAMCGFRPPGEIIELLRHVCPEALRHEIDAFSADPGPDGLRQLFTGLLSLDGPRRRRLVEEALARASDPSDERLAWVGKLGRRYPDDSGVLSPALMNVVRLDPGQALFLPAGVLHSYLEGTGIEIMANSDNVVRGGLTPKHIDIPELQKVVRFEPMRPERVRTERTGPYETHYLTPAAEFALSVVRLKTGETFRSDGRAGVEMLLCVDGRAQLVEADPAGRTLDIPRGASVLVPAGAPDYHLSGPADLYRARVPGPAR